jgi:hypothetical protein
MVASSFPRAASQPPRCSTRCCAHVRTVRRVCRTANSGRVRDYLHFLRKGHDTVHKRACERAGCDDVVGRVAPDARGNHGIGHRVSGDWLKIRVNCYSVSELSIRVEDRQRNAPEQNERRLQACQEVRPGNLPRRSRAHARHWILLSSAASICLRALCVTARRLARCGACGAKFCSRRRRRADLLRMQRPPRRPSGPSTMPPA